MATWTVEPVNPNDPFVEDLGDGRFFFDTNDEDHDIEYTVKYVDDNGCEVTTSITQMKCECVTSYAIAKKGQSGDCFCNGIDYEAYLYDRCNPSVQLATVRNRIEWDRHWTQSSDVVTSVTESVEIEYQGNTYIGNVTITSTCEVRTCEVYIRAENGETIKLSEITPIPFKYCDEWIDIGGSQSTSTSFDMREVKWIPTDSLTVCDSNCGNDYSVTLPDALEATINDVYRVTFVKVDEGKYAGQEMSVFLYITVEASVQSNGVLKVTFVVKTGLY